MTIKTLLVLSTFVCTVHARAANYYFSSSGGNDNNSTAQAQNPATPWKSFTKLNSFFGSLQPGDTVFFKRNDSFYGTITVSKAGAAGRPIVLDAYGSGANPVITGLVTVNTFTNSGNGVWTSAACANCGSKVNILIMNNVSRPMGRYPNANAPNGGFLTYESHVSNTSITDNELSTATDWTGATLVVKKERWATDRSLITAQSGHTISYKSQTSFSAADGYGYFIQNDLRTLDVQGEWYYNPSAKNISLFSTKTTAPVVKVSTFDNLLVIHSQSNVAVNHLAFTGSNGNALDINYSQNIAISNCTVNFSGIDAVYGYGLNGFTVQNSTINNTNNNAVFVTANSVSTTIKNNVIKNTGINIGMGDATDYTSFCGISVGGAANNTQIVNNEIDSTGFNGITFAGTNVTIKNNFVNYFCFVEDDGGGIYTSGVNSDAANSVNRNVTGNIVVNGGSAGAGTAVPAQVSTWGIYMDDNTQNVSITGNTVANMPNSGVFLHNASGITVNGNTLYNNKIEQLRFGHDYTGNAIRNVSFKNNILFAQNTQQLCFRSTTVDTDINSFGVSDSNFYCRPIDEDNVIYTVDSKKFSSADLSRWNYASGKDANSNVTAKQIEQYTVNQLLSANMVSNGNYDKSILGSNCYNPSGSCTTSWDNSGKINGGSLKLAYTSKTSGITDLTLEIGAVAANTNYILKFSTKGTKQNVNINAFLRQTNSPYNNLTKISYNNLTTDRTDYQVWLPSTAAENYGSLVFEVNDVDSAFWIDNIQLYSADVTVNNPDDYIRFEYNAGKTNKTVQLDGSYIGVSGTVYNNSVTLQPYTSIVLVKSTAPSATGANGYLISRQMDRALAEFDDRSTTTRGNLALARNRQVIQ